MAHRRRLASSQTRKRAALLDLRVILDEVVDYAVFAYSAPVVMAECRCLLPRRKGAWQRSSERNASVIDWAILIHERGSKPPSSAPGHEVYYREFGKAWDTIRANFNWFASFGRQTNFYFQSTRQMQTKLMEIFGVMHGEKLSMQIGP